MIPVLDALQTYTTTGLCIGHQAAQHLVSRQSCLVTDFGIAVVPMRPIHR